MAAHDDIQPSTPSDDTRGVARAAVIHDVNQMLAVITGRAELMRHRTGEGPAVEDLEAIVLAATDAAAMLRRLDGPGEAPEPAGCTLADEVRRAGLLVRPADSHSWQEPGEQPPGAGRVLDVQVDRQLGAALPGQVVREVLVNLFLNALEAMPDGGGLTVAGKRRGDRVEITVADEGPGLDTAAASHIFEPGVSRHDRPGRGLGLPGCRLLLAPFGAHLDFVPDRGPGAVFRLDLPAAEPVAEPADEPVADPEALAPAVLVVDDEPGVRGMLIDLLGEMGCETSAAADVRGALDVFAPGRYQVVLLDQSLPDGNGRELAARMRVADPWVALVLMTGLDRASEIENDGAGPVDLTALKPLTWEQIRRLVDQGSALNARRQNTGD